MKRPILLHIVTVPESLGFLIGQAAYMRSRGLEVRAISSEGPCRARFQEQEGVPVTPIEMRREISPIRDLVAVVRIWREIRRIRPAVVHSHTPKGGLLGMIAAWLAGVPVRIYHIHGFPFVTATGIRRWLLRTTERVSCTFAHEVLCVSHSLQALAVAERICSADRIRVIGGGSINGVDADGRFNPDLYRTSRLAVRSKYGIPSDAPVLGFVGRIVRDKGIIELMEAWSSLREAFPEAHLLVVGPVEPQDPVPDTVLEQMRADPRVHLHGVDWEIPPLLAAMDLLVLPSYREGFPVTPLEAAAMGLPVVATRIPGCIDAVEDGVTGTLVEPRDPEALRRALERYLRNPLLRRQHGEAGRARVRRQFRQEILWQGLFSTYERHLARRGVRLIGETKPRPTGSAPAPWVTLP